MKKYLVLVSLLVAGCAKVGDYQNQCEQRYAKLSDVATCLDGNVRNDYRLSRAAAPKLYVLTAKQLGQAVDEGQMTDTQARVELQKVYLDLQRQDATSQAELQKRLADINESNKQLILSQPTYTAPPVQTNPIKTTTCTAYGNSVNCQTF